MKYLFYLFIIFSVVSCNVTSIDSTDVESGKLEDSNVEAESSEFEIEAEKESWMSSTKSSSDKAFAKDIPWQIGEKVMVIRTDTEKELDDWNRVKLEDITYMCTVSKAAGLKCRLESEVPLEDGVYQAIYPAYDYVGYDVSASSLTVHLSFLYELDLGLDYRHQDIVISEPITYKKGHKLSFVMKHICALVDIDIYPPKTGNYFLLKVIAGDIAFAGKANYYANKKYDINSIADCWFNFATLRGDGNSLKEGELFETSTGLLPVQYDGMPMNIYLVYEDGTYYLSETFSMPSLNFGVANKLVVDEFTEIQEPMQGFWGDYYMYPDPQPHDIIYWDSNVYL